MTAIGLIGTATYLPRVWMPAADVAAASGIPEHVIVEKFGLRGKHVAGDGEHVSDMAVAAARRAFEEHGVAPAAVDAVVYFGSTWKDHAVWQAAPAIAHRLGCTRAFALELDYVSCGSPVAVRVVRDLMVAEPELQTVLAVAACRESHLVDYRNPRARFTYNFGDGAVAALFGRQHGGAQVLGSHMITDGQFAMDVLVPAGGSIEPASHATVDAGRHTLDVPDPAGMKERLDPVSLDRFVEVARGACDRSGITLADIRYLCGIHMKRSIHEALVKELGLDLDRAAYLDNTGHMSGVDPLLAYDRAVRGGVLADGDPVLLLAAGTGYTWAASVLRHGDG